MSSVYQTRFWEKSYNWKTPTGIKYPKAPAYYLLREGSIFRPQKIATSFYGAEITFGDLYKKVTRFANALVEQGIQKGDRVGILLPNSPQFVISYWAVLMSGAIVVNLNPIYTQDELRFQFQDSGLTGLITYNNLVPLVKPLCQEINVPTVIVTSLADFMPNQKISTREELGLEAGWHHFSQLLETDRRWAPPRVNIAWDDPAVIQYTGGTTGKPKGAVLTQYNVTAATMATVEWCIEMLDREPQEIKNLLCIVPYFHIYGEICCICYAAFHGLTQYILPRFDTNEVIDTLLKVDQWAYWPAVPTMLQAIFYSNRVDEIDWHEKLVYTGSGAAPASLELYEKCRDKDFNFFEGYGMSETTAVAITTPGGNAKPRSVGVPYIDMDLRLVDENGNDVPLGEPGEIWMKGPYIMKEYWNNPEETKNVFSEDGWLKSGDVAYMDEDGYVFIVDRTKDMIIAGGYNIYPRDVEEVLLKHPKVADAMVIGVPDEYRGETVKAFIQLVPGETVTIEELNAYCRASLAAYKVPNLYEFRDTLPRSATGKALRRILKEEERAKTNK